LEKTYAKYKATAEQEKLFKQGDMIMVYLMRERIPAETYNNVKPKKYGSFKIVNKISDNSFVVDLSSDMVMSKIFNVADLREYHSTELKPLRVW